MRPDAPILAGSLALERETRTIARRLAAAALVVALLVLASALAGCRGPDVATREAVVAFHDTIGAEYAANLEAGNIRPFALGALGAKPITEGDGFKARRAAVKSFRAFRDEAAGVTGTAAPERAKP